MPYETSAWVKEYASVVRDRLAHFFVFTGNVYDYIPFGGKLFGSVEEFLAATSPSFDFLLEYSLSSGPLLLSGDEKEFMSLLGISADSKKLSKEDRELMVEMGCNAVEIPKDPSELFPKLDKVFRSEGKKVMFIFRYADSLLSGAMPESLPLGERSLRLFFNDWARYHGNGHSMALIARHSDSLDKSILDRELGTYHIHIKKPSIEEREAFCAELGMEKNDIDAFAKASAGLSLRGIESVFKSGSGQPMLQTLFAKKREILEKESGKKKVEKVSGKGKAKKTASSRAKKRHAEKRREQLSIELGEILYYYADDGDLDKVKSLIMAGASLEFKGEEDHTPLLIAADRNRFDVVIFLVKARADLNARSEDGKNALMKVINTPGPLDEDNLKEMYKAVDVLLAAGIDLSVCDNDGDNILDYAINNKDLVLVKKLIAKGMKVDIIKILENIWEEEE